MSSRASRPRSRSHRRLAAVSAVAVGALLSTYAGALRPTSYAAQVQAAPGCPVGSTPAANDAELQARVLESTDDSTICVTESFALSATLQLDDTSLTLVGRDDSDVTLIAPSGSRHVTARFPSVSVTNVVTVQHLSLVGGRGDQGGAAYVHRGSLVVADSQFYDNSVTGIAGSARAGGGALMVNRGDMEVSDSVFVNVSSDRRGGAIQLWDGGELLVQRSRFTRTEARTGDGGAIFAEGFPGVDVSVVDSHFEYTSSGALGGAIHVNPGTINVVGGSFSQSNSTGVGGAIFATSDIEVMGTSFNDATASSGGALFSQSANVHVAQASFVDCEARTGSGGAVLADESITAVNSTFVGNSADDSGGAIHSRGGAPYTLDLEFVTITGNSGSSGGGVYVESGVAVSITNSIIAVNTASATGADVALAGSATLDDSFNIFTSASSVSGAAVTGGTNIFGDPKLNPLADNGGPTPTMLPKTDSPVYLAGDPNWTAPPAFDQRGAGFPRNAGGRVSMGAIQGRTPPPPPIPTFPPGPPQDVTAETKDGVVTVSWLPPTSSGSFPVSTYQVDDSTGTHSCLVTVRQGAELRCTFDDLIGGRAYEFRVRALNGAGWGAWSSWSDPVTPVTSRIVITGTRTGREVKVLGVTTGLVGATVTPRLRFPGPHPYRDGLTRPIVDASGDFTWQRQTRKKVYVYFLAEDVRSNRVIIKPQ